MESLFDGVKQLSNFDKNLTVLVLSAQKDHVETIVKALKKLEITNIQTMDNGIEALQTLTETKFGLLISDQNIRFISGWLLIKEIKTSDKVPNIPTILFGKDGQPESDEVLKRYGLIKYLKFPVTASDLEFTIYSTVTLSNTSGTVEYKYTKAKDSLIQNRSAEAIERYSELRSLTKNGPRSSMGLAQAFLQDNKTDAAGKVMEELATSDEKSPGQSLLLAKILLQKQDNAGAVALFESVIVEIPNGFYFTKIIRLLNEFQQLTAAAAFCLQAMEKDLARPEFLVCLAKERYNAHDIPKSLEYVKKHDTLFGMTNELHNIRGVCFKKSGDFDKAIESYEMALRLSPTDARVYFNLAMCSIAVKRNEEAIHYLQTCLKYAPTFPKAKEKLDEILKRTAAA